MSIVLNSFFRLPNKGVVEVWMPALALLDNDEDDLYMIPPPETVHNENANNSEDEDDLYMTPPPENLFRPSHYATSNPAQPPISLAPPIQLHQPATLAPPIQSYYSVVATPSAPSYYPAQYVPPHFYPAPMFQHSIHHGAMAYQIPGQYPIYALPPMPAPPPHYWPMNVSAYPNLP
ncbi:hypothetical protein HETIRDRAFT_103509 [Heterobasidion irregulare TC 32-1]|uniref:Uncharacterized protein n=1 Tax=Heterobasidion irregulare (strain TC 32-1) TaxID=747525 RepID=W4K2H9_HETIT|nr:uncharacterized protein HETIRDRAFT_103509 [Heterobasidion irregulare TC 32-1]ETW79934.1 hypothetical protein HETIRDRAFT_103509 [Heterobasidion irregulare TC 32-1]